ncbi:MAG: hypothetical protein Q8L48_38240 [Archangium sp.]|nr:hypothetical protein [Archangium sp.]
MTRAGLFLALLSFSAFADPQLKGTLKERLDSGGYSYLRVETAGGERWAAVPQVKLEPGAAVAIDAQAEMKNFESKSLKRTWAVITFGTLAGAPSAAAAAPSNPHQAGLPKTSPVTAAVDGTVLEVIDTKTYTYLRLKTATGETWAAVPRAALAKGAEVRVVNAQPMDGFKSPSLNRTFERIVFGTLGAR